MTRLLFSDPGIFLQRSGEEVHPHASDIPSYPKWSTVHHQDRWTILLHLCLGLYPRYLIGKSGHLSIFSLSLSFKNEREKPNEKVYSTISNNALHHFKFEYMIFCFRSSARG